MVYLLLNKEDQGGLRLSRSLKAAGRNDLELISAEELVYAPSFECGFANGKAFFSIRLHRGLEFTSETVHPVLNRIQSLPLAHLKRFKEDDQSYVATELKAIFTFLFSILPNSVFNQSTGQGLCGNQRSKLEWLMLAKEAGFIVAPFIFEGGIFHQVPQDSRKEVQTVLYFDQQCYGLASDTDLDCCRILGNISGERILEIYLRPTNTNPLFVGATIQPQFHTTPTDFIHHLNRVL